MSVEQLIKGYFWVIFKNVVGWLAIAASPILGIALPGPGGIPLFIVGFALVTFPGKRKLTTHVFRGRRLPIESGLFTGLITFFSVLVTAGMMWAAWRYYGWIVERVPLADYGLGDVAKLVAISVLALPVTMVVTWIGLKILNYILLNWVPGIRRFLRRTLRKYGVRLLPTRRRRIGGVGGVGGDVEMVHDEIIGLDDSQRAKLTRSWQRFGPWLMRLAGVSLLVAIMFVVIGPVLSEWDAVEARIGRVDLLRIAFGIAAFALGLLVFRAATWRSVLSGFDEHLPRRAAARVWALGYLARYIPGRTYVVLRMELARPYGISGLQANVSQRTEGILALFAAIGVGAVAFWWTAYERMPQLQWLWLVLAVLASAALLLALPTFFYKVVPNEVARRNAGLVAGMGTGRSTSPKRLRGPRLAGLMTWQIIGVLWQSLAVWLLVGQPLMAEGAWLAVGGAWACAWAAGHLAGWAPGGIGVREVVFVACLSVLLPPQLRDAMRETFTQSSFLQVGGFGGFAPMDLLEPRAWQDVWWAFLFFLSLLLRLATMAAEFLFASIATAVDWPAIMAFVRGETHGTAPLATTSGN